MTCIWSRWDNWSMPVKVIAKHIATNMRKGQSLAWQGHDCDTTAQTIVFQLTLWLPTPIWSEMPTTSACCNPPTRSNLFLSLPYFSTRVTNVSGKNSKICLQGKHNSNKIRWISRTFTYHAPSQPFVNLNWNVRICWSWEPKHVNFLVKNFWLKIIQTLLDHMNSLICWKAC